MHSPRILVVGAGPTGIGAAWRMEETGHQDWALFDAAPNAGGLATSIRDDAGFTWDLGGHVLFSHYKYFDALMNAALADAWVEHVREAWVWMRERWLPYPLQNNIWRLPPDEVIACIEGLIDRHHRNGNGAKPRTFRDWLEASFGEGLCRIFMHPYNTKVWAHDPAQLDVGWMGERVAPVDLKRIVRNVLLQRDDAGWGPNATFRFPLHGGTGAIWNSLFASLPQQRVHLSKKVVAVDTSRRTVTFADGAQEPYEWLISTMPLDVLLRMSDAPAEIRALASQCVHSSTHVVGVGMEGKTPDDLRTKCWLYFPEPETPFYRVTVFSNYSPNNVARPGAQWSLMAEVSESQHKPVDSNRIVADVVAGLRQARLLPAEAQIATTWHRRLEYGYPTPWLGRDDVLEPVNAWLEQHGILSRGRFGAWKYEVSNQDHSVMQGVEAVERILRGSPEHTFNGDMKDWLQPTAATGAAATR